MIVGPPSASGAGHRGVRSFDSFRAAGAAKRNPVCDTQQRGHGQTDKFPPCQRAGDRGHRDRIVAQRFAFDPDGFAICLTAAAAR
jgi:hypothetical protein